MSDVWSLGSSSICIATGAVAAFLEHVKEFSAPRHFLWCHILCPLFSLDANTCASGLCQSNVRTSPSCKSIGCVRFHESWTKLLQRCLLFSNQNPLDMANLPRRRHRFSNQNLLNTVIKLSGDWKICWARSDVVICAWGPFQFCVPVN
jgi:hypothetical protein